MGEAEKPIEQAKLNKNKDEEDFNDGNGFAWPTITSTDVM